MFINCGILFNVQKLETPMFINNGVTKLNADKYILIHAVREIYICRPENIFKAH